MFLFLNNFSQRCRLLCFSPFYTEQLFLRCYVNVKVRKFELLFYKIKIIFVKIYHLHWIACRENIPCKYIIYIFCQFWTYLLHFGFIFYITVPFIFHFLKLQLFVVKKSGNIFPALYFCMTSKIVSQIFKILFPAGDINIFLLRGVFFSRYVQLKNSFSDEKNISGEMWETI